MNESNPNAEAFNKFARYDVVLTIGAYAGQKMNKDSLPADEARMIANHVSNQRGRPEMRLNIEASRKAQFDGTPGTPIDLDDPLAKFGNCHH